MKHTVDVMSGGEVIGTIVVEAEDAHMTEPVALAAVAFSSIEMRVGDQEIGQHEIAEWWA